MRYACRKDKVLIGADLIFVFSDAVPSGSIYAIDEYVLVNRLVSFAKVMLRFRVVAYVGNVKRSKQRVFFYHADNQLGKDDGPFSVESVF